MARPIAVPEPSPTRAPHGALPVVPSKSEAFAALIAKESSHSALRRLRRYLLGERLYCDYVASHNADIAPSLDQITKALPSLTTLPELAMRANSLLNQVEQLTRRDQDPTLLGQAAHNLLTQIAESLRLLEQSFAPGLASLRGPILRRLDSKILTARRVEDPSFSPITRELLILRDQVQRMGDLLDSQRASLRIRRATLTRLLATPDLLRPDTQSEATALVRSLTGQLERTFSTR